MPEPSILRPLIEAAVAGLLASVACGLGVLPLFLPKLDPKKHIGLGYGVAGGLMFSASVYNLIYEGLAINRGGEGAAAQQTASIFTVQNVVPVIGGILVGALFLHFAEHFVHARQARATDEQKSAMSRWGGATGMLVFIAMTIHSIPEGVAVGTGYALQNNPHYDATGVGTFIALAIAIHNMPEGLAVAIPMRSAGASFGRCFLAAFLTSLPQPIAAIPAVLLAWFFEPMMPFLMGFAAGAMIFLVVLELIPEALESESPSRIAWAFTIGFCGMLLIQVVLQA